MQREGDAEERKKGGERGKLSDGFRSAVTTTTLGACVNDAMPPAFAPVLWTSSLSLEADAIFKIYFPQF